MICKQRNKTALYKINIYVSFSYKQLVIYSRNVTISPANIGVDWSNINKVSYGVIIIIGHILRQFVLFSI